MGDGSEDEISWVEWFWVSNYNYFWALGSQLWA